jgi:CubicO group peptidase (beta-lactamase class C family)
MELAHRGNPVKRTPEFALSAPFAAVMALAAALVGCGSGSARTGVPSGSPSVADTVDSIIRAEMQRTGVPAISLGLAKNGSVIYAQSYGVANLQTGDPATRGTVFEIASLTKQFTAALILQLQEQGLLTVDDPVAMRLPGYGFPSDVTIAMLLHHASGLPDYLDLPAFQQWYFTGVSEPTVLAAIAQAPLQFAPGTSWTYSNSNYFVAGAIIEKLTGLSYAENLAQRIFGPLAMSNTYYELAPAPPAAAGYTVRGGVVAPVSLGARSSLFAAGALSADIGDLLVWNHALFSGAVVSPASFKLMTTPAAIGAGDGSFYGFGLFLDTYQGRPRAFHTGDINGFLSYSELFLDDGFSLVLLMNADFDDQQALGDKVYGAVCGGPATVPIC